MIELYFIIGFIWSVIFTGGYVIKFIKLIQTEKDDIGIAILVLILLFIVSFIFWPISMYHNLPYLLRKG